MSLISVLDKLVKWSEIRIRRAALDKRLTYHVQLQAGWIKEGICTVDA